MNKKYYQDLINQVVYVYSKWSITLPIVRKYIKEINIIFYLCEQKSHIWNKMCELIIEHKIINCMLKCRKRMFNYYGKIILNKHELIIFKKENKRLIQKMKQIKTHISIIKYV